MHKSILSGIIISLYILFPGFNALGQSGTKPALATSSSLTSDFSRFSGASLLFAENKGQVADRDGNVRPDILFTGHSNDLQIFLTATGIHYQFSKTELPKRDGKDAETAIRAPDMRGLTAKDAGSTHQFTLSLEGANPHPVIRKKQRNIFTENYYLAHCPQGITGVKTFERLEYENVYPGINWVIYSNGRGLKYDFVVRPGADPTRIKIKISNAGDVEISPKGELVIKTTLGEVKEAPPLSYCGKKSVETQFSASENGIIGFSLGNYNKKEILTIDPTVSWATYYGGTGTEYGYTCGTDTSGNVYFAGNTTSTSLIASGGFQNISGGGTDAMVVKFNNAGTRLWATYYGGAGYEEFKGFACDTNGFVYLCGITSSATAIASGGYQNAFGGSFDAMLVKFNNSGARIWSTYFGGTGQEDYSSCAIDLNGNIYLGGSTESTSGISSGGFQSVLGGVRDGFLAKFNAAGTLQWGTYYGGASDDIGLSCASDINNNIYLAGTTSSATGISAGGFQNSHGGSADAFLVKFNSAGIRLWGTYYGGLNSDQGATCATDGAGNVYLGGSSTNNGLASSGLQNTLGGGLDGILVKFNTAGIRLWATYYGLNNDQYISACAVDKNDNVFITGTTSPLGTTQLNPLQNYFGSGSSEIFIGKINSSGTHIWGSGYGGPQQDLSYACATDRAGNVFVGGITYSSNSIATPGAFQTTLNSTYDGFLAKIINFDITTGATAGTVCAGAVISVPFTSNGTFPPGNVYTAELSNNLGSFSAPTVIGTLSSNGNSGTITATIPGGTIAGTSYYIRVTASMPAFVGRTSQTQMTINALPAQPTAITGNATACSGSSQTYTTNAVPGATSYVWTVPAGWTGTSTTNSLTTTPSPSGGTITVAAVNSCGTSAATSLPVTVLPSPSLPGTITGAATVCNGVSQSYSIAAVSGATSYLWSLPPGWSGTSATNSITTTPTATGGTVTVTPVGANSCSSAPATLTVTSSAVPATPGTISGFAAVCLNSSQTYSVTAVPNATSYTWALPPGWTGTSATNSITATAGSNGNITVSATGSCGTSGISTKAVTVNTNIVTSSVSLAASPGVIICASGTVTLTATPVNGGPVPFYLWYKNGVYMAPQPTSGPVYTPNLIFNNDTYYVELYADFQCVTNPGVQSNTVSLSVYQPVTPILYLSANPGTTVGPNEIISFTSTELYGGTNPGYVWKKNGVIIPGETGSTYTVNSNSLLTGDVISLTMLSNRPCVINNPVTSQVTMTITDGTYIASTGTWKGDLTVYPNPSRGRFDIKGTLPHVMTDNTVEVEILNTLGQRIFFKRFSCNGRAFTFPVMLDERISNGLYHIQISSGDMKAARPLTLMR